jgi:hypothetical protein
MMTPTGSTRSPRMGDRTADRRKPGAVQKLYSEDSLKLRSVMSLSVRSRALDPRNTTRTSSRFGALVRPPFDARQSRKRVSKPCHDTDLDVSLNNAITQHQVSRQPASS